MFKNSLPNVFRNVRELSCVIGESSPLRLIGKLVFYASGLTRIHNPDSVEALCEECFSGCRSLSFVKFGTFSSLKLISKKAFCSSSLFEICIPDSVEVICGECFYSCMCLLRMTFGESSSLKRLGNLALCDTILRSFAFPESVACVGESLFSGRRTARCVMYDINYSLDACDGLLLGKDRRACSSHIGVLQRAVIRLRLH